VNFRLISATRKNLEQSINAGAFREDFFYRINVIHVHMPPLRDRKDDIPLLVEHFLEKYSQETAKRVDRVSGQALEELVRSDWPGNIRELENAIERAVVLAKNRTLTREDFAFLKPAGPGHKGTPTLKELEKNYIVEILNACDWNVTGAAKILGINRVTLHKKIKRLGLKSP
jgi:two-component system response regulator HydG